MPSPRHRRIFLVLLSTALLISIVGSAAARPPPQPLCEVCSDTVVADSAVEESTVTIQIDESGTGHWTVRFDIEEDVSLDPEKLQRDADESLRGHVNEPEPRNLSVTVDGDSAVITYEIPRMGHRTVGDVLVVDYFYSHGDQGHWYGVNADTVVIQGPDETVLTRSPTHLTANESAVVLDGEYGDVFARTISTGWFLAYAPNDGVVASGATTLGIGIDIAQAKIGGLPGAAWLPIAVLLSYLGYLYRRGEVLIDRSPRTQVQYVLGLTAVLAVATLVIDLVSSVLGSPAPFVQQLEGAVFTWTYGAVFTGPLLVLILLASAIQFSLITSRFDVEVPDRWQVGGAVTVALVVLIGGLLAAGTDSSATRRFGMVVAILTPLLFFPLGRAERRSRRVFLAGTITISPLLVALSFGPYAGYTTLFFPLLFVPWTLVTGAIGSFGYIIGLDRREEATGEEDHRGGTIHSPSTE